MDEIRNKLVELQKEAIRNFMKTRTDTPLVVFIADHLIANGVTVQRWIPVDERLPETVPCSAGTAYSEAVNVLTDGRKVLTAIWNGERFLCDADYWEAWGEKITHWTPVLLPLPEPPGKDVGA